MKKLFLSFTALCAATSLFADAQKSQVIDCGETVKIVATPKEGQHFMYWNDLPNTDADYSKPERLVTVKSDTTIYAIFQINKYKIEWYSWDGTFIVKDSAEYGVTPVFPEGSTVTVKPANAQYTYFFNNKWSDDTYIYTNGMQPAKNDTAYYAVLDSVINQYTLTYAVTPEGKGTITGTVGEADAVSGTKYDYGSKVTLTAEADDECYKFIGWFKADDLDGTAVSTEAKYEFELQGDVSLVAKYEKKQFTITVIAEPAENGDVDIVEP